MKKVWHKLFFDSVATGFGYFYSINKEVASVQTPFQHAEIFELEFFGRSLVLDGKIQSTEKDEFIYHEALVHPAMLSHPFPQTVLVIGGGEGATLREVLRHESVKQVVMVDIDEQVVNLCREHLGIMHQGSFDDSRVQLVFDDARKFLERSRDNEYDVIIMDSTDPLEEGPAYLLFTVEFYSIVARKLSDQGVMVVQSNSAAVVETDCFTALNRTLREVFPHVVAYSAFIPAFGLDWGFNMASRYPLINELESTEVMNRMKRIKGDLRYLDEVTFNRMFALPKDTRELLAREDRIIRDSQPLYVR